MKPFRFETTYTNARGYIKTMKGIVFANTIEEAKRKTESEYGGKNYVCEIANDIIEDIELRKEAENI